MGSYTYANLQTRISDEIGDSANASVTLAQVKKAIISAIEYYERERTWFSEIVAVDLTVAGAPALGAPPDLVFIDKLQIATTTSFTGTTSTSAATVTGCSSTSGLVAGMICYGQNTTDVSYIKSVDSSSQITLMDVYGTNVNAAASGADTLYAFSTNHIPLEQITYDQWASYSYGPTGGSQPCMFAYNENRILLYPTPGSIYGAILSYNRRLTTLSADSDNNGWTNFCEPLIRSRAKWDIFNNLMKFPDLAKTAKQEELDTLMMLDSEREQRNTTGRTRAVYL